MRIVLTKKKSLSKLVEILEQGEDNSITLFVHKKALPLVDEILCKQTHGIKIAKGETIFLIGKKRVHVQTIDRYV